MSDTVFGYGLRLPETGRKGLSQCRCSPRLSGWARTSGLLLMAAVFVFDCDPSVAANPEPPGSGHIKVMTFNILCSFCKPGEYDPWEARLTYFADVFARHEPDLVGVQELVNAKEVDQFKKLLPDHDAVFYKKGKLAYPDSTIFYRRDRFELIESGVYWLSPRPDKAFTRGFAKGPQLPRCVAWAMFRQVRGGTRFLFATTHFDNNPPSQERSAPLLLERTVRRASDLPVIVTGDFNSKPGSKAYAFLTQAAPGGFRLTNTYDAARDKQTVANQTPTPKYDPAHRIDHVFVGGPARWTVHEWVVDLTVYGKKKRYPSDHLAIIAEVAF